MAKVYARERSAAKSWGKGKVRYSRKKTSSRVSKRSGTSAKTKMDAMVAREVQKVLNSGALNEPRKVTMTLSLSETQIYINGKAAFNNCIRIPITAAIPAMAGASFSPDIRRKGTNKVVVTAVNVRLSFAKSNKTRVILFLYKSYKSVRNILDAKASILLDPSTSSRNVLEIFATDDVFGFNNIDAFASSTFRTLSCGLYKNNMTRVLSDLANDKRTLTAVTTKVSAH